MEVHHHAHTPRRKWTHYFWEFLMLFLAVFCGFLAEYKLEHTIEHQRANVYATNLYEDLKKDTSEINRLINRITMISGKLDTLCLYSTEKKSREITNAALYYYSKFITSIFFFSSNNATLQELKGSGNLRLMKNNVAQQLSQYDTKIKELDTEYALTKAEFIKIEELYFKIFDVYRQYELFPDDNYPGEELLKANPPLNNNDPALMKEFIGWIKFETGIYENHISNYLKPVLENAADLLILLKKEYRIK